MNTSAIPEEYRCEHLFVLIGRNPLPNYIAARLLLRPGGALYLVHSEGPGGTGKVAQNLAAELREYQYRPHFIPVREDPLGAEALREGLRRHLPRTPSSSIGLNYTGGTKAMAVHSYRTVEEFYKDCDSKPIFSYLNADTLTLAVEPGFEREVVQEINLSFQDLFQLHGIRLSSALQTEPRLPELAENLARIHGTLPGIEAWKKARQTLVNSQGQSWQATKVTLFNMGITDEVLGSLEKALGFVANQAIDLEVVAKHSGLKSANGLLIWLDGSWLEDWTLACVKALDYSSRARSLVGRLMMSDMKPQQFEIDVAVLRGYQLFALSCGVTTDRRKAKHKLLEIYTRARQLGGEEARIALVCPLPDAQSLELELAGEWDIARPRVFGAQHLLSLKGHLKQWFESM